MNYTILFIVLGIFVLILFLSGVFYTFREFNDMEKHPEDFRRRYDKAEVSTDEDEQKEKEIE